jgi:hypothetical protein
VTDSKKLLSEATKDDLGTGSLFSAVGVRVLLGRSRYPFHDAQRGAEKVNREQATFPEHDSLAIRHNRSFIRRRESNRRRF